jgi:PPOX class probable F420-dependent enzyme
MHQGPLRLRVRQRATEGLDVTLTPAEHRLLTEARRATLATTAPNGHPRLVPICFVVGDDDALWTPLDDKPKTVTDVRDLARVRDIVARPEVAVLVDRWAEDWSELAWLRISGRASLVEPTAIPAEVRTRLRAKYPQYRDHDLGVRPALRIEIVTTAGWSATSS